MFERFCVAGQRFGRLEIGVRANLPLTSDREHKRTHTGAQIVLNHDCAMHLHIMLAPAGSLLRELIDGMLLLQNYNFNPNAASENKLPAAT